MKTLYLRIYLTVVAVLLLFALGSGWLVQRKLEQERTRLQSDSSQRLAAWAELLQNALPAADAPADEQAQAVLDWSSRLRMPLALDDGSGQRIVTSPAFARFTGMAPVDGPGGDRPPPPDGDGPPRPPPVME
ncbi:MAG TPA: two-component sensor histidine kinase, partial [Methylibium sp.]|nr:two-component sensor histidine kinase [Methylibium sp.]